MKTCLVALLTATGFLLTMPARSADPVPGTLWENTSEMQMPGMGMSMPARTSQSCVPKNSDQPPVSAPDKSCEMYDVTSSGGTTHWKMRCTGKQAMTGEGEMTYQGKDAYSGRMTMNMDNQTMTMKMSGKRLGDCDAGAAMAAMAANQKQAEQSKAQMCAGLVSSMQVQYFDGTDQAGCGAKYKTDFCKRLSSAEGYDQLASRDKSPLSATTDLEAAGKTCAVNTSDLRAKLCKSALSGNSLPFLARNCPDEAAPIAQAECAGRVYSGVNTIAPAYQEFCNNYAGKKLREGSASADAAAGAAGGGAAAGAAAPSSDGQQGTSTAPPPKDSAIDEGKKVFKKLFPF